jgi:putrescine transport system permease protein
MRKFLLPMPGRRFVIGVPYVWLGVFFFLPFLILLYISFVDMGNDISPFKPLWDVETGVLHLRYENYWSIFRAGDGGVLFETIFIEAYVRSIWYVQRSCVC